MSAGSLSLSYSSRNPINSWVLRIPECSFVAVGTWPCLSLLFLSCMLGRTGVFIVCANRSVGRFMYASGVSRETA